MHPTPSHLATLICTWLTGVAATCVVVVGVYALIFSYSWSLPALLLLCACPVAIVGIVAALRQRARVHEDQRRGNTLALGAAVLFLVALLCSMIPMVARLGIGVIVTAACAACAWGAIVLWDRTARKSG